MTRANPPPPRAARMRVFLVRWFLCPPPPRQYSVCRGVGHNRVELPPYKTSACNSATTPTQGFNNTGNHAGAALTPRTTKPARSLRPAPPPPRRSPNQ